jgi:hypothetical protein
VSLEHAVLRRIPFSPCFDRTCAAVYFFSKHRRWPRRFLFNDRLFWLKWDGELLDPLRQFITDKALAKEFVRARVSEEYLINTHAILATADEILSFAFPQECVIKPTHASGTVMLCRDGRVDRELLASWLRIDHYRKTREQNYAFLKPRIIVEEFAFDPLTTPEDYRVFCVNGVPRAIVVDYDHFANQTRVIYDAEWKAQPYSLHYPQGVPRPCPQNLEEMLTVASLLSRGFSFIRVDLYSNGRAIKVGELTNTHGSGGQRFSPIESEPMFSNLLFGDR